MDRFQQRLKSCTRCSEERLRRDFSREHVSNSPDSIFVYSEFILLRPGKRKRNLRGMSVALEIQTAYQSPQKMSLKPNRFAGADLVTHALNFVTISSLRRADRTFFCVSEDRASWVCSSPERISFVVKFLIAGRNCFSENE